MKTIINLKQKENKTWKIKLLYPKEQHTLIKLKVCFSLEEETLS